MSVLIAIEGIDGSGKGTQAARLEAHLKAQGRKCTLLSFPRYQQTGFGRKIGDFLNGKFGSLDAVHPLLVSLLFAGDRFESRHMIRRAMAENDVLIFDRYVASNVAHQGAKIAAAERQELIEWIKRLEYEIYELPAANLTLFLDVDVQQAQQLIAAKARRTYTEKAADLQEADAQYLQKVRDVYLQLTLDPGWKRISCVDAKGIRLIDQITSDIIVAVNQVLK